MKTGVEEKFFQVVGRKNPMRRQKYHELTYYQRVWILKALCDYCLVSSIGSARVGEYKELGEVSATCDKIPFQKLSLYAQNCS